MVNKRQADKSCLGFVRQEIPSKSLVTNALLFKEPDGAYSIGTAGRGWKSQNFYQCLALWHRNKWASVVFHLYREDTPTTLQDHKENGNVKSTWNMVILLLLILLLFRGKVCVESFINYIIPPFLLGNSRKRNISVPILLGC